MTYRPLALLALCAAFASSAVPTARADVSTDAPAVVVVLEASGTRIDAARLRRDLEDELGIPAISILEASRRPNVGVLAIAVTERGRRAAIQFLPTDGLRYAIMVDVRARGRLDAHGHWLVAPCASVVRSSNERRAAQEPARDHLDPWIATHGIPASAGGEPRHSIDPWYGLPRTAVRVWVTDVHVAEEVEDPWADAVSRYREEQQRRVAPASPRDTTRPSRPRRSTATTPAPGT